MSPPNSSLRRSFFFYAPASSHVDHDKVPRSWESACRGCLVSRIFLLSSFPVMLTFEHLFFALAWGGTPGLGGLRESLPSDVRIDPRPRSFRSKPCPCVPAALRMSLVQSCRLCPLALCSNCPRFSPLGLVLPTAISDGCL